MNKNKNLTTQGRILLIESDPSLAEVFLDFFLKNKFFVKKFNSPKDFTKTFNTKDFSNFDLIIAENNYSDLSGIALISDLRRQKLDIPVILITEFATANFKEKIKISEAAGYLSKPFELKELLELAVLTIEKYIKIKALTQDT